MFRDVYLGEDDLVQQWLTRILTKFAVVRSDIALNLTRTEKTGTSSYDGDMGRKTRRYQFPGVAIKAASPQMIDENRNRN